jgi:hypothetical protein
MDEHFFAYYLGALINAPFDIEPEDFDAKVIFPFDSLFSGIELLALVDVLAAGVTSPGMYCS